jgi:hypothetical protein
MKSKKLEIKKTKKSNLKRKISIKASKKKKLEVRKIVNKAVKQYRSAFIKLAEA